MAQSFWRHLHWSYMGQLEVEVHLRVSLPISWSLICGLMLFCLVIISLFTENTASDLEWYSHRLMKRRSYFILEINKGPIDIWKSDYANYLYGCSQRSPNVLYLS
ncbi:O-fucosyltransferase 29-like [Hibiscus syriacus]|uniref:O-fucosyltransferase 29-like n=1 Tax=Hibiscus syriacus TaxID=106335 RepID=UPI001920A2A7|nr:O-fucosyltransferase 29-like [Hibiscus syriacus]